MVIQNKMCSACAERKDISQFYRNAHSKDGHLGRCKTCHSKVAARLRDERVQAYTPPPDGFKKTCTKCNEQKQSTAFSKDRSTPEGLCAWCKHCVATYKKSHYFGTKEYQSQKAKEWYVKNSEKAKQRSIERHRVLRQQALEAYSDGDPQCRCCGERELKFLAIDHINGGGKQHRREIKASNVYYWAKVNGYPSGFQVLCHNCNLAKGFYGACPHIQKSSL
jgi:hypothetical protein